MYKVRNYDNVKEVLSKALPLIEKTEEEILKEEYERRLTHRKRTKNFRKNKPPRCRVCNCLIEEDKEHHHHRFCHKHWAERKSKWEGERR